MFSLSRLHFGLPHRTIQPWSSFGRRKFGVLLTTQTCADYQANFVYFLYLRKKANLGVEGGVDKEVAAHVEDTHTDDDGQVEHAQKEHHDEDWLR